MPINASLIIAIIGLALAIAVWLRARRIGPVIAVVIAAFIVMAITDPGIIAAGGTAVGNAIKWAIGLFQFG